MTPRDDVNDPHTAARSGSALQMLWAFSASGLGKGLLTFALGTLTLSFGVARHAIPALGAGVVTIGLGVSFVLDGVVEIAAGFALTSGAWLIVGAAISLLGPARVGCSTSSRGNTSRQARTATRCVSGPCVQCRTASAPPSHLARSSGYRR